MTRPRATLVSVADTPYYHVIGRCVRRAWLCGEDPVSGKSFEHRKPWILDRLRLLTDTFAIDLCAYALMSNHYHLVVRLDPVRARHWRAEEVHARWSRLYRGAPVMQKAMQGEALATHEMPLLEEWTATYRARLTDLSWFMRCLNEPIARQANEEDGCTGRFWEGRFKSQALLDEGALLTAMVYVDLNPIRAGMAESVLEADFTSGQQRLLEIARREEAKSRSPLPRLLPFAGTEHASRPTDLPFNLKDYLAVLDGTGRIARPGKRGTIPDEQPPLLAMLGLNPDEWLPMVTQVQRRFELFLGTEQRLRQLAAARDWKWVRGITAARRLYSRANE